MDFRRCAINNIQMIGNAMTAKPDSNRAPHAAHPGIAKTVVVDAPVEAVYRSVSTTDGFRGWWAKNIQGSDAKGGKLVLRFPGGHVATVSLAWAADPSGVEWAVTDHNEMKEWIGTSIIFAISATGTGKSRLDFLHAGLGPECECYEDCEGAWGYLMGSLKDFVEKGRGGPV
jgi:uncharacterized protein YndB with AHSA1/START domain